MELHEEIALITGGASGIGFALAQVLAQRGATVVLGDVDGNRLSNAADDLRASGMRNVDTLRLDVSAEQDWDRVSEAMIARYGGATIICNNAGVSTPRAPVGQYDPSLWSKVIGINLTGVFLGCDAFLSRMRIPGRAAHILNTASVSGLFATPQLAAYTASKHAVIALSDAIRFENTDSGVSVSVLCPGFVNTAIAEHSQQFAAKRTLSDTERAAMKARLSASMDARTVAESAVSGLLAGEAYIFPHPEYRQVFERRVAAIADAFERSSPIGPADEISALGSAWLT